MAKYSITLNFFIPRRIVEKLKKVKINGKIKYDWRSGKYSHCTVKAIHHTETMPAKKELSMWIKNTEKILSFQKPFKVKVEGLSKFPTALFAGINSNELIKLHKKLFKILPSSQPKFENNKYVPHASIAMIYGNVELIPIKNDNFGEFIVKELQLMIWNENIKKSKIYCRFKLN